jgi:hypothetical protein
MNRSHKLPHVQNPRRGLLQGKPRQQRHGADPSPAAKSRSPKSVAIAVKPPQQQQTQPVRQFHHSEPVWLMYGYTMHTQNTWRSQQDQLRRWQDQERQQGVMTEEINQQEAKKAEAKGSGFVNPKPNLSVFVNSATPRPPKPMPSQKPSPTSTPVSKIPLGY